MHISSGANEFFTVLEFDEDPGRRKFGLFQQTQSCLAQDQTFLQGLNYRHRQPKAANAVQGDPNDFNLMVQNTRC